MLSTIFNQSNQSYYANYFSIAEKNGPPLSWNWGAFIFSCFWLMRRKLYMYATFFAMTAILGSEGFAKLGLPSYYGSIWILFVMCVVLPIVANKIYYLQTFQRWQKNPLNIYHWTQPHGVLVTAIITILMFMWVIFLASNILLLCQLYTKFIL